MKICPVTAELFHADGRAGGRADGRAGGRMDEGQTDIMKLIVVFRNLANAPKTAHFPKTSHDAKFRDHKMGGPTVFV
jgi:hypothetical protein